MISSLKKYLIVALTLGVSLLYGLYQRKKSQLATERQQDAEAQRDVLTKAQGNINQARREGDKREKDAIDRANDGDWSGFN